MKRISILLYTCCCLLSCSYKQENEIMKQQCEEWFAVERTYLYDNYQVGDSIFFIDENDSRQGFVIQKQTKDYQIEYTKGTLLMKSQEYISGLHLSISLQQEIPYFTSIDIYETYNGTEKVLFSIQHNNRNIRKTICPIQHATIRKRFSQEMPISIPDKQAKHSVYCVKVLELSE